MQVIYSAIIQLYGFIIFIVSSFNKKAFKWIEGRKNWPSLIMKWRSLNQGKLLCIHAASLGEYEQGRLFIEMWRKQFPTWKILLTFYSPSGFDKVKDVNVDGIFYLPLDSIHESKKWIALTKPDIYVFIRYEFWFNLINQLCIEGVPTFFVSAHFRKNMWIFKDISRFGLNHLSRVSSIFCQDSDSVQILQKHGLKNAYIMGDGRIDRVAQIAHSKEPINWLEKFKSNRKLFIAGSVWPLDEDRILPLLDAFPDMAYLIAPHDVSPSNINRLVSKFKNHGTLALWSDYKPSMPIKILVLDTIGWLSRSYAYADLAFIGGGYKEGLHSILEPAAFGCPLFFGPKHKAFPEAQTLIDLGGAIEVFDSSKLIIEVKNIMVNTSLYNSMKTINQTFIASNQGASKRMLEAIAAFLNS